MILAFIKFYFRRTLKNGRALRSEVLKRMPKQQKKGEKNEEVPK